MRLPIAYEFIGDYDLDFDLDRQSASEISSIESVPESKLSSNMVQIAIGNSDRLSCPAKSDLVVRACTFKAPLCVGGALTNYPHPQFESGMTCPT